jgi:SecD/SecF fusion protein
MLDSLYSPLATIIAQAMPEVPEKTLFESITQSGYFVFLTLIAAIVIGFLLAKFISEGLRLKEYRSRLTLVLVPLLIGLLLISKGWPPKFGVDLKGGINMIGSLNLDALKDQGSDAERPTAASIIPNLIRRVNPSGTKEIMIRPLGEDKIEVTIPSASIQEANEIWERLVQAGKLEFRICADAQFHTPEIELAKAAAAEGNRSAIVKGEDGEEKVGIWVALARENPTEGEVLDKKLMPFKFAPMPGHLLRDKSTGKLIEQSFYSQGISGAGLSDLCAALNIRTPQILMIFPDESQNVEGKHLSSVSQGVDKTGLPCVNFQTTTEGNDRLGTLTVMNKPKNNKHRLLGIVLDGQLHSAPRINGPIYSRGEISGQFTTKEIQDLIINLRSGKIDVALNKNPISQDFIESTLGKELRDQGFLAIGISLALVLVFMIFYYRFAGIVATIGLILNLVMILALIMAIKQPFTLTGLAGLVLTVGMSVDANVLIFERIREELDRGAALRLAIRNGFDKATTTIVDANVTTLITAIVLYWIGTEQIKGFAVTLILGIVMSMYTAIFVSRLIFDIAERKRWLTKLNMMRIMEKSKWDFLGKVSMTATASFLAIALGLFSMFALGPKILSHDLRGGSTVRMVFNEAQDIETVRQKLNDYGYKVKDEKIDFSVTGFSQSDEGMANRVYKVDSNLPAWEGGPEEDRWLQLDELMTEIFPGELQLHNVKITSGVGGGVGQLEHNPFQRTRTQVAGKAQTENAIQPSWNPVPAISALTSSSPTMLLQDAGTAAEPVQELATPELETPDLESPDLEVPQTEMLQTETPATETPATTADGTDAATTNSTSEVAPTQETQLPGELGGDFPSGNNEATIGAADNSSGFGTVTETTITVDPPLLGKTLRAELVEQARRLDLDLDEETQVILDSKDIPENESADGTVSNEWTIKLAVSREGDGEEVISKWAEKFNKQPYFPTASKVGGQIAKNTQFQAGVAILLSLLGIIGYVWIRFQNIAFGLAAVVALIHDVLFVLGAIAISHWVAGSLGFLGIRNFKISLEIVAALLTVIGYSLNDTIVVFDRIREVRGKRAEITSEIINTSISQTLSRTILTSVTTFIVVFILYCFGGEAIHGFAFSLVIGVLVGTYSSIFIASPVLLWLMNSVGLAPESVEAVAESGTV